MSMKEKRRRAIIYGALIVIVCLSIVFVVLTIFNKESVQMPSNVANVTHKNVEGSVASNEASEKYNEMIIKHDNNQSTKAAENGESYFSIPINESPEPEPIVIEEEPQPTMIKLEEPKPEVKEKPRVTFTQDQLKRMTEAIAILDDRLSTQINMGEIAYIQEKVLEEEINQEVENYLQEANQGQVFKSGEMYYAIVDTAINSDVSSAVMATVVTGDFRKTKFIGSFARFDERIVIKFDRAIMPDGTEHSIEGYAVDPDTTEASVASKVNTHFFSRWGGLIAASFLEGFGEATQFSGAETVNSYLGEPTGQMLFSNYSLAEQSIIAAGKVGERASEIFAENFNRPPTVYLNMGSAIGILLISAGR